MSAVPKPTGWLYGDRLRAVGIKLFADGALGSRGAWLKQPYADKPDTRGLQFHSDAEMLASGEPRGGRWIPDRDARDRRCRRRPDHHRPTSSCTASIPGDRRWRIEHFQIVDPGRHQAPGAGGDHRVDAADAPDERPADGRGAAGRRPAAGQLCLAERAEKRRPAGVRIGLPGRIAQPLPRTVGGDQPAGHQRPAAGRVDAGGAAIAGPGAPRLHARRGLCRVRGSTRSARSIRANGPISS